MKALGHEVRVVTPRYSHIRERQHGLRDVARLRSIPVKFGDVDDTSTVKSGFITGSRVQTYFIDNTTWFTKAKVNKDALDGASWKSITGSLQYFCHISLQLTMLLEWIPDIIHCNGWESSLAPYLIRCDPMYKEAFESTRSIMQVAQSDLDFIRQHRESIVHPSTPEEWNEINPLADRISYLTGGLLTTDGFVDTNPQHTSALEPLSDNEHDADKNEAVDIPWNPRSDSTLVKTYGAEDFKDGKAENRKTLTTLLGFNDRVDFPVIAIAPSAIQGKKSAILSELGGLFSKLRAFFVLLPTGDNEIDQICQNLANSSPDTVKVLSDISDKSKHLLLAGADILLMPSPCGSLGFHQADAMLYGTIPIAGSLEDKVDGIETITSKGKGSGFVYNQDDSDNLLIVLDKTIDLFADKKAWQRVQKRGLCGDFSWAASACELVNLYEQSLKRPAIVNI